VVLDQEKNTENRNISEFTVTRKKYRGADKVLPDVA
jgi:hypothetical protein